MPVRSRKNQYSGVNAHLHSELQALGDWEEFHGSHITHLTAALKAELLPMGYTAHAERSVQTNFKIFDTDPARANRPKTPFAGDAELVIIQ